MKTLGLDIGTTSVSAAVVENGEVLSSRTLPNEAALPSDRPWEKIQNPEVLKRTALSAVSDLVREYPDVAGIGVTGQMHGILYHDAEGNAVSPLYTWQDGRGDLPFRPGFTYAARLREITGYPVATGYGTVTHFYNLQNGLVPAKAVGFCTVHDWIAMNLCGGNVPLTDATDAASLGLFDLRVGRFDEAAAEKAGFLPSFFPKLAQEPGIGLYREAIPVFAAIGDNQASFLGATGGERDAMLVNVGTGSQFSVFSPDFRPCPGLELRPFPGGGWLLVGAPLCGGRAYALLERFFRETVREFGGHAPADVYGAMGRILESAEPADLPAVLPLFQGTREDPTLRGEISGLSTENFTPRHLIWAMLEGMTEELFGLYRNYRNGGGEDRPLIGSGNGLRKNRALRDCVSRKFGQELRMSGCMEEAAAGAALFAQSSLSL